MLHRNGHNYITYQRSQLLVILNLLNSISASLKENDSDSTDINDCLVFDPVDGLCEPHTSTTNIHEQTGKSERPGISVFSTA